MPACLAFVALTALLSAAAPALAQAQQGRRYALLVGVKTYDHRKLSDLKYTENDAEELARVLRAGKYDEVVVLTTTRGGKDGRAAPTKGNIERELKRLLGKVTKRDVVLVGLAGHGVQYEVKDGNKKKRDESFFCPSDARLIDSDDFARLSATMLPFRELFRQLDDSGAGSRLLLVDACRNDVGSARNADTDSMPAVTRGTAALFACKGGERAYESDKLPGAKGHGVFFHYVIEALRGAAKSEEGEVTWNDLARHVSRAVVRAVPKVVGGGAKQTPELMARLEGDPVLLRPGDGQAAGEAERLFREGMDVLLGLTKEIDEEKALKLFRRAAEKGHAVAAAHVGLQTWMGIGVGADRDEGLKKIKASLAAVREKAEGGNADAQSTLGMLYRDGRGVGKDERQAVRWMKLAADQGHADAMSDLGSMYAEGRGVGKDEKEAVAWYRKAADKGHAGAMDWLGYMLVEGRGAGKDEKEAVSWYRKAADKDNAQAMYALGLAYAEGGGVEKDEKEAVSWYRKAAEKDDAEAMRALGDMYAKGKGVEKDDKEAAKWHRKAADKGEAQAMYVLGMMYHLGRGVGKDQKEAVRWHRKAADKGDALAMHALGLAYAEGGGVEKDEKEAVKWYRRAADKGNAMSMYGLGLMYAEGRGVKKDPAEARRWYKKAADLGDERVKSLAEKALEVQDEVD